MYYLCEKVDFLFICCSYVYILYTLLLLELCAIHVVNRSINRLLGVSSYCIISQWMALVGMISDEMQH